MLLSAEDIERLERKGYRKDFFTLFDKEGYARLRNLENHCVFYDAERKRCMVYSCRPLGCRLYPVIHDSQKGIILDHVCRAVDKLNEKQIGQRGWKVLKLLERIDAQAESRHNLPGAR